MNVKAVSKMALGGICIAAASFGIGKCSGNSEIKYVDNILTEDVVEISNPTDEHKELPQISYEHNDKIKERCGWTSSIDEECEEIGIYGASIHQQAQMEKYYTPTSDAISRTIFALQSFIDRDCDAGKYADPSLHPFSEQRKYMSEMQEVCYQAEKEYQIENMNKIRELIKNGAPTLKQCEEYINQRIMDLLEVYPEDIRNEDLMLLLEDFDNFKKAQGKPSVQKQAELFAYQQYKIDSIAHAQIFQASHLLEKNTIATNTAWGLFDSMQVENPYKPKP